MPCFPARPVASPYLVVRACAVGLARTLLAGLSSVAILASPAAYAQASDSVLDDDARRAIVEAAAEALRSRYVFPDVGERAAATIEAELAAGSYDDLGSPWEFAEELTENLQEVTQDDHLRVFARDPAPADPGAATPPWLLGSEGGVTRADRLAEDIGYIEVSSFPTPEVFKPAIDRAMAPLKDTRALIIDTRRNGGGSPVSVSYLVSYFLDEDAEPVKINEFIWRNGGTETFRTEEFWSTPTPFSYAGKPVYVLTSERTFSGGEGFGYHMQVMELGILVGERTGGGANPGGGVQLASGLSMFVPGGRARSPITGTNWEGVGVTPDVATSSADALKVALELLGQTHLEIEIDALSEAPMFEARTTPHLARKPRCEASSTSSCAGSLTTIFLSEPLARATREQPPGLQQMFMDLGPVE